MGLHDFPDALLRAGGQPLPEWFASLGAVGVHQAQASINLQAPSGSGATPGGETDQQPSTSKGTRLKK